MENQVLESPASLTLKLGPLLSLIKPRENNSTLKSKVHQKHLSRCAYLYCNEKENLLKPERGKDVGLQISDSAKSALVSQKAVQKWQAYYGNLKMRPIFFLMRVDKKCFFSTGTRDLFTLNRYHHLIPFISVYKQRLQQDTRE